MVVAGTKARPYVNGAAQVESRGLSWNDHSSASGDINWREPMVAVRLRSPSNCEEFILNTLGDRATRADADLDAIN